MATITSLGGLTLQCTFGKTNFIIFPLAQGKADPEGTVTLFAHPDEEPPERTISWPGEYDFNGIYVRGLGHEEGRQVSYVINADGIRCLFLSSPLHSLSDTELEWIGDIDVLVLPIDDVKIVQHLIDVVDPRVLIPLATKEDKAFQEVLKICGAVGKEVIDEYKVKGLPAEGREVVLLKGKK
ncbi:MAG: MBL fold metallo-hydrolase [Candidatus Peregrinibacteria bacterium]